MGALKNSHYYTLVIEIQTRARFYNLNVEGSSIKNIHTAVLSSSHILDDNYLVQILNIMKHPHKKEREWFNCAKTAIETKFKVEFSNNKKISLQHCRLSFQQYIQSKDEKGYATE